MTRRSRKSPFAGIDLDNVQLNGIVAKWDGMCDRCHEDIVKGQTRIVINGDRVTHVTCASGFSDE